MRCSIVIAGYNAEDTIAQAVASAIDQTHPDTEIIVVNDGSTDMTAEVLRRSSNDITILEQPNRGLASARNLGIAHATGDLIALLDADDWWMPNRLERMVAYMQDRPDVGLATSDAYLVRNGRPTRQRYYSWVPRDWHFRPADQSRWILQANFVFVMAVFRADLIDRFGTFDEDLPACEDWDLWCRFITGGVLAGLVDEPLAYYRLRAGSMSGERSLMTAAQSLVLERAMQRPASRDLPGLVGSLRYLEGRHALVTGDTDTARTRFRQALRDPALPWFRRTRAMAATIAPGLARAIGSRSSLRAGRTR